MKALQLDRTVSMDMQSEPLKLRDIPIPVPGANQVLIQVEVCGVCHTEIDEIEGRTSPPKMPVIPGHQVVGRIIRCGENISHSSIGARVGVAWIFSACGECEFCREGMENLCPDYKATGRDRNGGYAEYMVAPEAFTYPIPDKLSSSEAAPLLCAGAIGYRSLGLTGISNGQSLGLTGFGASAHLVLKMALHRYPDSKIFVFARDPGEREFALELGACWAGNTEEQPPELIDAIIDTTPVWKPVVESLKFLRPGGRLVINAIRKEDIDKEYLLNIDYAKHLWQEKEIKSVANVTRKDVSEFLELAAEIPLIPEVEEYELESANQALLDLKNRKVRGAKVLRIASD